MNISDPMDEYNLNERLVAAKCHGFPKYRNLMLDGKLICAVPTEIGLKMAHLWNEDWEKKTNQPL